MRTIEWLAFVFGIWIMILLTAFYQEYHSRAHDGIPKAVATQIAEIHDWTGRALAPATYRRGETSDESRAGAVDERARKAAAGGAGD